MRSIKINDFSLEYTLESGQFFHFEKKDQFYYLVSNGKLFRTAQDKDRLFYEGVSSDFVEHFFSLDINLKKICSSFPSSKHLNEALEKYKGLRILRQDPWECTLAFILSSVSSIKNIKKDLKAICAGYGKKLSLNGFSSFSVPDAGFDATEENLRRMRVGFRSVYVEKASKMCQGDILESIERLDYNAAKERLVTIPGVGPKIAGCVLLFAYGLLDSFPVDTWIRKIMTKLFLRKKVGDEQIADFGREYFGQYAGYAQQYLYIWSRQNKHMFK